MKKLKKRRPIKDAKRVEAFAKKLWLKDTYLQRIFENDNCSPDLFEIGFALVLCYSPPADKKSGYSTIGRNVVSALITHPLFTRQHLEQLLRSYRVRRDHLSMLVSIHKDWMLEFKELVRQKYASSFQQQADWHNKYMTKLGSSDLVTGEELFEQTFQKKTTLTYKRPDKFLEDLLADLNDVITFCISDEQAGVALLSNNEMIRKLAIHLNQTQVGELKDGT